VRPSTGAYYTGGDKVHVGNDGRVEKVGRRLPCCPAVNDIVNKTRNLKAIVRYDGTDFAGWQVQPVLPTVQGAIEGALSRIANRPMRIQGAGRTDAGVHALGQVFSCAWPGAESTEKLRRALSSMLEPNVRIESVEEVPPEFHAQKSARSKRYAYTLSLSETPDPLTARYAWCVRAPVDLDIVQTMAARLEGEHDFAGYQGGNASVQTTVRTIHEITV
jgi:tRNA pseudouridine38-40 synthase